MNTLFSVTRYHDISCGHRVVGHEGKCRNLHGHNYRIHFHCRSKGLDSIGRVIDFSVIKSALCQWLEDNWDHRMLIYDEDPLLPSLLDLDETVVEVPFNPTAENMAWYLLQVVAPKQLPSEIECFRVQIEETRKCSADVYLLDVTFVPHSSE